MRDMDWGNQKNSMNIINKIKDLAKSFPAEVALGVSSKCLAYAKKNVRAAEVAFKENLAKPLLVGEEKVIRSYLKEELKIKDSREPEVDLVHLLSSGVVEGAVRGSLKASKTLSALRKEFHPSRLFRIGLIETVKGDSFFIAPVGIDEGKTLTEKLDIIVHSVKFACSLGLVPKVGILSGGRKEDLGRCEVVDKSLAEAEFLASRAKDLGIAQNIKNYDILIEEALRDKADIIIAPDGISGNLVYRTLIHLGGGSSHGGLMVGIPKIFIDTSRAAPLEEYVDAIAMASALISQDKIVEEKR